MQQLDIFDIMYDQFHIDREIDLYEFFAGIGSQAKALVNLRSKGLLPYGFKHKRIAEWAVPSILAYASIHRDDLPNYGKDFTDGMTKDGIVEYLVQKGVSVDYNKPAEAKQLKRIPEDRLRLIYNSIIWENNLVDVSRVHADDLDIDTKKISLLTYSFPCQDLSNAGRQAGCSKEDWENGNSTRSGLLWEVERILLEGARPTILMLENVQQLVGEKFKPEFDKWCLSLENMGYRNYWKVLNASDYGIPQNRQRCFMISIHGDYNYDFPKPQELKLRLKDMLEDNVDKKYFLSDKMIAYVSFRGRGGYMNPDSRINLEIARPLTTEQNKRAGTTNYISEDFPSNFDLSQIIDVGGGQTPN